MSLAGVTVRRPVATTMGAVCAFLFGLLSLQDVPLDLLPDLSYPAITIEVPFAGASPQEVESLLVRPVEDAVAVSQGLSRLSSTSQGGSAQISLLFRWGTDMNIAALEVREKLQQVQLPSGAGTPRVLRFDPTQDPILRFALTLPTGPDAGSPPQASEADLVRLRLLAEDRLKPALERLEGVAAARVRGGHIEEVRVLVDPRASALEGVTLDDIVSRLQNANVNLAGGILREGRLEYRVRTLNELRGLEDLRRTVVANPGDAQIALAQVAQVIRGTEDRDLITRLGRDEAVEVSVYKASGQNTVAVARRVQERLGELQRPGELLSGAEVVVTSDQSYFIRSSLDDLASAAWTGGVLAILVLLLFLRDLRATLIVAFAIPLSVVTTFLLMRAGNISLNVMSLGGIALAIGMLVDNAIVVLESIAARREAAAGVRSPTAADASSGGASAGASSTAEGAEGAEEEAVAGGEGAPAETAIAGTGLVSRAVIASTLTTLSVFLPLLFVEGVASRLFTDQALTLTIALLASLVASLSVIPMLAATTLLTSVTRPVGRFVFLLMVPLRIPFDLCWKALQGFYPKVLNGALRLPGTVLVVAVLGAIGLWLLGGRLGADFLPDMHPGLLSVEVALPQGSALKETDAAMVRLAAQSEALPQVQAAFSTAGAISRPGEQDVLRESVGQLLLRIEPGIGAEGEAEVVLAVRAMIQEEPGLLAPVFSRPGLVSARAPLEVLVDGKDLNVLRRFSDEVARAVSEIEGLTDVRSSARGGRPEVLIALDRRKLALYDLDAASVSQVLETAVRGRISTDMVRSDRDVPIRVLLAPQARASLADIERIVVSPAGRAPVVLASVGSVAMGEGPVEIRREGQRRVSVVSANVSGRDLGSAAADVGARVDTLDVPPGFSVRVGGSASDMGQAFEGLAFATGLALLLVYLILAAQFESFIHPVIIMGAVPFAGAGAVLGLLLTGTPVSVVVLIGGVVLAGIVVNNAILLVDRMNQLRRTQGLPLGESVRAACADRLRPVIMTTLTTVLGLLPLAIAGGEGAELRAPLAITVVAGLLGATVLTLVVVPCAYTLVERTRGAPE